MSATVGAIPVLLVLFLIILHPLQAFQAALGGLEAWWEIVVPALLPFFVLSQLLMGLGIVHFLGVFLEPFMRPLFNVPGSAAFVVLMGYTSGAPLSALLTAQLRSQGLLTPAEGERLICFTNNASPLFMLGAVAVGMLHDPQLGPIIAAAHYAANLSLGILFRFYRRREGSSPMAGTPLRRLPRRAWQALLEAQRRDGRPFGQLLSDAVTRSFQVLLAIGGFIVLFAVVIRLAQLTGVTRWLEKALVPFLRLVGLDTQSTSAVAAGMLEMTIGTKTAGELPLTLPARLAAISFILGWAGLSVHAQVAAMISGTDLRLSPFIGARLLHGVLASKLVLFFYGPAQPVVNLLKAPFSSAAGSWHALWIYYTGFPLLALMFFISLTALGLLVYALLRRPKNYWS
ncbi:MAG: sporulation integral membrane protein YlbJ [Thermoanaerobacteraceae bacterium]|uniref:sporulation integral membrane protein YlbJ n=1 Tax=Thermanaeromonas sp. C210 TaxID=2731925 RepID=UPI00155B4CB9|nr:sporulation integral membrane protein YlbJ [Thermanaeromonas sp. C210]MBE3580735.1 sporulation integral membrane protein YlbJ [Thermoanaerobacteraceae bacterium]GFN23986.1 sporulation integral membrane protein YlbJ [Thermanaeromonas sp. C210]